MIVWGGYNGTTYLSDGTKYNPYSTNTWSSNLPSGYNGRAGHSAIWTGTEMIIWGGYNGTNFLNDGAKYNSITNTWSGSTSSAGAPVARSQHSAIWTGTEMIIFGGYGSGWGFSDGAKYNPTSNTWTLIPAQGTARFGHSAIWTGTEMIVWGGNTGNGSNPYSSNDGFKYNPNTNTLTPISTVGAPTARSGHSAIWTGTEMIIWGGTGNTTNIVNDGAKYNPSTDSWTPISSVNVPTARASHTAIWTGSEMIIWGGYNGTFFNNGAIYGNKIYTGTTQQTTFYLYRKN
ncbi:MAG: hypothetical protein NTU43_02735 [Bacteroidetes bacterium]|nr:hypothetical protein [Bacteroidota bacterium]